MAAVALSSRLNALVPSLSMCHPTPESDTIKQREIEMDACDFEHLSSLFSLYKLGSHLCWHDLLGLHLDKLMGKLAIYFPEEQATRYRKSWVECYYMGYIGLFFYLHHDGATPLAALSFFSLPFAYQQDLAELTDVMKRACSSPDCFQAPASLCKNAKKRWQRGQYQDAQDAFYAWETFAKLLIKLLCSPDLLMGHTITNYPGVDKLEAKNVDELDQVLMDLKAYLRLHDQGEQVCKAKKRIGIHTECYQTVIDLLNSIESVDQLPKTCIQAIKQVQTFHQEACHFHSILHKELEQLEKGDLTHASWCKKYGMPPPAIPKPPLQFYYQLSQRDFQLTLIRSLFIDYQSILENQILRICSPDTHNILAYHCRIAHILQKYRDASLPMAATLVEYIKHPSLELLTSTAVNYYHQSLLLPEDLKKFYQFVTELTFEHFRALPGRIPLSEELPTRALFLADLYILQHDLSVLLSHVESEIFPDFFLDLFIETLPPKSLPQQLTTVAAASIETLPEDILQVTKRRKVETILTALGMVYDHSSGGHDIWKHPQKKWGSTVVPHHKEIKAGTRRSIVEDLTQKV